MNPVYNSQKLDKRFYLGPDVVELSRKLIGKFLVTRISGVYTAGRIVETEAYAGTGDRASHARGGRRTGRTEIMYAEGGVAYVYLCYGIHRMFNVITGDLDEPHAILIRAIDPADGIDSMMARRNLIDVKRNLTGGPGLVTQALGISLDHNGIDLMGDEIWIEDRQQPVGADDIIASARVGIGYAGEDALNRWRFRLRDNPFTSPAS